MAPEPFRARATRFASLLALLLFAAAPAAAVTGNGRLQVIHLDVGQGDGAVIISPLGQVAMIDNGLNTNPTPANGKKVAAQLQALGITHVDHHFASHYHADHIGLTGVLFGAAGVATLGYGWDRGGSYTTATYTTYVNTLGNKRRTLVKNQVITLDSLSAHPVTIKCVDLNGAGVSTTDENSLCLMLKVSYGEFDETFGGDLPYSGINPEIRVAAEIGTAEAYKVHHHGSATSSSDALIAAIAPKVAVVSCGNGNTYGHPTASAIARLHARNVKTYWTELGAGVAPLPSWDKVSNDQVIISATWEPGGVDTIRGNGFAETFTNSGTPIDAQPPLANLTAPDGGELWKVGSSHALTWTASDNVGVANVDLDWSADGGFSWSPIASAVANTGTYPWVVPASATTAGRVRVKARDAANNLGADSSLATFAVDWWTIAAIPGAGGTITPSGIVNVAEGASASFSIEPAPGFQIESLLVDGAPAGALGTYQFSAVAAHHTIAASFLDPSETAAGDAPPSATLLYAPFPNPIAGRATVRFDVARAGDVTLEVFDLSGRRASTLHRGALEPGRYSVQWNGLGEDGVPVRAGLYFVRLKAPGAGLQSARVTVVH